MILGRAAVALCPLDCALKRFVEQLASHHHHHDFTQHWHKHRHHVQAKQADLHQMRELGLTSAGIDLGGRYRMAAGIRQHLGGVLCIEVFPQIFVGSPDAVPLAGDCRRRNVRISCRLQLRCRWRWQFADVGERETGAQRLSDSAPWRAPEITGGIRCLLGELAEIVGALLVRNELAEEALVFGRLGARGLRGGACGEQTLELVLHLRAAVAFEGMFGIMRDIENHLIAVVVLLADRERHATGHSFFHQAHVEEPDLPVADPRMHFAVDDLQDHPVVRRLDVLFQQRLLGGGSHRGFLTGDELFAQGRLCDSIGRVEKTLQVSLILLADIKIAAQRQKLADRQIDRHRLVGARRTARQHETGSFMVGPGLAFVRFKVVQSRIEHREFEQFERSQLNAEDPHFQRPPEAQQGLVDIHLHLILIVQCLDQQWPGKGFDVLKRGHGPVQTILRNDAGLEAVIQCLALAGRCVPVPGWQDGVAVLECLASLRRRIGQPVRNGFFEKVAVQAVSGRRFYRDGHCR